MIKKLNPITVKTTTQKVGDKTLIITTVIQNGQIKTTRKFV